MRLIQLLLESAEVCAGVSAGVTRRHSGVCVMWEVRIKPFLVLKPVSSVVAGLRNASETFCVLKVRNTCRCLTNRRADLPLLPSNSLSPETAKANPPGHSWNELINQRDGSRHSGGNDHRACSTPPHPTPPHGRCPRGRLLHPSGVSQGDGQD